MDPGESYPQSSNQEDEVEQYNNRFNPQYNTHPDQSPQVYDDSIADGSASYQVEQEEEIKPIVLFDYRPGDQILIKSEDFLYKNLPSFSPNFECINPLIIPDISDQYGVVLDVYVPETSDPTQIDLPYAVIYLSLYGEEFKIYLPYTCFDYIQLKVEEKDDNIIPAKQSDGLFYDPFEKKSIVSLAPAEKASHKRDSTWFSTQVEIYNFRKTSPSGSIMNSAKANQQGSNELFDSAGLIHQMAAETIQNFFHTVKLKSKSRSLLSTNSLVKNLASETITKSFRRLLNNSRLKGRKDSIGFSDTSLDSSLPHYIVNDSLNPILPLEESKSLEMSANSSLTQNTTPILPLTDSINSSSSCTPSTSSRTPSIYSNNFLTDRSEVTKYVEIDSMDNLYTQDNTNTKAEEGIANYDRHKDRSERANNNDELVNGQTSSVILEAAKVLHNWENNQEKPDYFKFESHQPNRNDSQNLTSSSYDSSEYNTSYNTSITLTNNSSSIPMLSETNLSKNVDSVPLSNINSYEFDHTFEPSSLAIPLEPLNLEEPHTNQNENTYIDEVDLSARSYDAPQVVKEKTKTVSNVKPERTTPVSSTVRKTSVDRLRSTTHFNSTVPAKAPATPVKSRNTRKSSTQALSSPTKVSSANSNGNTIPSFKIEHEIYYIFDYIYYNSMLKNLSSFSLTLKEVIILLDSISFPINSIFYRIDPSSFDFQYEELQLELDSSNPMLHHYNMSEIFNLPINHPISLTATLVDIIKTRNLIFNSSYYTNNINVYLNEKNSILIINNLLNIIKSNYVSIRNLVFFHCFNKNYQEFYDFLYNNDGSGKIEKMYKRRFSRLISVNSLVSQSDPNISPRLNSASGIRGLRELKNKSNLVKDDEEDIIEENESEKIIRPKYFNNDYLLLLFSLMDIKLSPSLASTIDGNIFLSLSQTDIENTYGIKKSLLKSRFFIIQLTLKVIDIIWEFGIRPYDLYSKIKNNYSLFSLKNLIFSVSYNNTTNNTVLRNFKKKSNQNTGANSLHLMNLEDDGEEEEVEIFEDVSDRLLAINPSSAPPASSKSSTKVIIISSEKLFLNYLPYYRTYGWNFPLAYLTQLCDNIGGLTGKVVSKLSDDKKDDNFVWVQLDLKKNKYLEAFLTSLVPILSDILIHSSNSQNGSSANSASNSLNNSARLNDGPLFSSVSSVGSLNQFHYVNNVNNMSFSSLPSPNMSFSTLPSAGSSSNSIVTTSSASSFHFFIKVSKNSIVSFNFLNKLKKKEKSTYNLNQHISNTTDEDDAKNKILLNLLENKLNLGMKVKIIDNKVILNRLLNKYEWWDRPNLDVLSSIVGKEGEIISLADLHTKRRVGLKIFVSSSSKTQNKGEIIYDALPIEALIFYNEDEEEISFNDQVPRAPLPPSSTVHTTAPPAAPAFTSSASRLSSSVPNSTSNPSIKKEKKLKKKKSDKKIKKKSDEKTVKKKKKTSEINSNGRQTTLNKNIDDSSDNFSISSSSSSEIDEEDLERNVKEMLNQNNFTLTVPVNQAEDPPLSTENSVPFPFLNETPKEEYKTQGVIEEDIEAFQYYPEDSPRAISPSHNNTIRKPSPIRAININKKKNYTWMKPIEHCLDEIKLPEEKIQVKVQEANLDLSEDDFCVGMNPNAVPINTVRHSSPNTTRKIKSKLNETKVAHSSSPIRGVAPVDSHINHISEIVFKSDPVPIRPTTKENKRSTSPKTQNKTKKNEIQVTDLELEDKEASLMKFDLVYEGDTPLQPTYPYSNTSKIAAKIDKDSEKNKDSSIISQNIKKYSNNPSRPSTSSGIKKKESQTLGIFDEDFTAPTQPTKPSTSKPSSASSTLRKPNAVSSSTTQRKKDETQKILLEDPKDKQKKLMEREARRNQADQKKKEAFLEKQLKSLSK